MLREQHPELDDADVEAQVQKALAEVREIKKHTPTFLTVDRPHAKDFERQLKLADGRFRLLEEAEAAWKMVAWLAAKRKADELSKPQSELFAELVRAQWNELNLGFASPNAQESLKDFDQKALSIGTEETVDKMTAFYLDRVRLLVLLGNRRQRTRELQGIAGQQLVANHHGGRRCPGNSRTLDSTGRAGV